MTNNSLTEIVEQLKRTNRAAVFCHARPDGDALGAGLALTRVLQKSGRTVDMYCEDSVPEKFMFLPAMNSIKREFSPEIRYDTFISVDCADISRMGIFADSYLKFSSVTVNIDHHISNRGYAKFNYVYECPATCELLTEILFEGGFDVDKEIADLLMLGLITDSGNFTHNDVSEKTFSTAAKLRAKGADVNIINYNMYSRQSKPRAVLYGKVMSNIRFALDDKLTFIVTTLDDLKNSQADKSETEGFVDFPLTVDGVEVSVSIMEVKKRQYKVSLRSKGKVNVNSVAGAFGGGGHVLASGCMLCGELEEVIDKITYAVYQNL